MMVVDLSAADTITRADLVRVVESLGLDAEKVLAIRLDENGIVIHSYDPAAEGADYRVVTVRG